MVANLDQLRDECGALRDQVTAYATPALAHLGDIGTQLSTAPPSTDELIDALRQVQAEAQGISAQAEDVFTHAKTILDNQNAYQQQLNDEYHATQSSYNQLLSQVSDAQHELDEAESTKRTMSFWTLGLSDVVADITGLQDDIDRAEGEMHNVQMQLMYQSMIVQGTAALLGHTSKVVDILSGIRNTITMVTADLDHLFAAHPDTDKLVVLRLFVSQATDGLRSLISDAA
jgi:hypothetical protein